jgi:hypothetical protein
MYFDITKSTDFFVTKNALLGNEIKGDVGK